MEITSAQFEQVLDIMDQRVEFRTYRTGGNRAGTRCRSHLAVRAMEQMLTGDQARRLFLLGFPADGYRGFVEVASFFTSKALSGSLPDTSSNAPGDVKVQRLQHRLGKVLARRTVSPSRRGFTLIELMIVVGLIGLVLSILVPIASASRHAAREARCRVNLQQIGLATLAYADTYRALPVPQLSDDLMPGLLEMKSSVWQCPEDQNGRVGYHYLIAIDEVVKALRGWNPQGHMYRDTLPRHSGHQLFVTVGGAVGP